MIQFFRSTADINTERVLVRMIDLGIKIYKYEKTYIISDEYLKKATIYLIDGNKLFKYNTKKRGCENITIIDYNTGECLSLLSESSKLKLRLVGDYIIGLFLNPQCNILKIFSYLRPSICGTVYHKAALMQSFGSVQYKEHMYSDYPYKKEFTSHLSNVKYIRGSIKLEILYKPQMDWSVYKKICCAGGFDDILNIRELNMDIDDKKYNFITIHDGRFAVLHCDSQTTIIDKCSVKYVQILDNCNLDACADPSVSVDGRRIYITCGNQKVRHIIEHTYFDF